MKSGYVRGILVTLVVLTLFAVTAVFAKGELPEYEGAYQNEAGQIFFMPKDPQRSVRSIENSDVANEAGELLGN